MASLRYDEFIAKRKSTAAALKAVNVDPVREADGDVLIALSRNKKDHILVKRTVLEKSTYFAPLFSGRWSNASSVQVDHPTTGESVRIWKFGLVCVDTEVAQGDEGDEGHDVQEGQEGQEGQEVEDVENGDDANEWKFGGSWMLESGDPHEVLPDTVENEKLYKDDEGKLIFYYKGPTRERFYRSVYASGFPYRPRPEVYVTGTFSASGTVHHRISADELQRIAIIAHKLLFRLVYGLSFELDVLPPGEAIELLADVVAYAEMYDLSCQGFAERVAAALTSITDLWMDVAKYPAFHVGLAIHIQDDEIYRDAIKHLIGNISPYFTGGLYALGPDDGAIKDYVLYQRTELAERINSLRIELARLVMTKTTIPFMRQTVGRRRMIDLTLLTTFFGIRRRNVKKTEEDSLVFITTSIFNEWLTGRLGGFKEHEWERNSGRVREYEYRAHLRTTCNLILKHAYDNDTSCFGEDVGSKTARLFKLKTTKLIPDPPKMVNDTLLALLHEAAKIVEEMINEHTMPYYENPDAQYPYFTLAELGVSYQHSYRPHLRRGELAEGEFTPASQAWAGGVGLLENGADWTWF